MNEYRAVGLLAACLRGDAEPATLRRRLMGVTDWQAVALFASGHGVSPAVHPALLRTGVLDALPAEFRDYLEGLWLLNAERNRELLAQACEVDAELRKAGLGGVFLKGLASLAAGLYPDPGERLIADIDILLAEGDLASAREALLRAGYQHDPAGPAPEIYAGLHQEAPLFHPRRPAPVELHRRPLMAVRAGLLFERLGGIVTVEQTLDGHSLRLLTPTLRLAQAFLHLMVQDSAYVWAVFNLRQLREADRLARADAARIDWPGLRQAAFGSRCGGEWCAFAVALNRLFGTGIELSAAESARGELWYARAYAYARWPGVRASHRQAYQYVKRWTPAVVKRRFGLADYGWGRSEESKVRSSWGAVSRSSSPPPPAYSPSASPPSSVPPRRARG